MTKYMLIAVVALLHTLPVTAQYNWQILGQSPQNGQKQAANEPGIEPARLLRAYPNPASDQLAIEYYLEDPATITFRLIDSTGKMVTETPPAEKGAFRQTESLQTGQLPSGTYFLTIQAGERQLGQTLVVIQQKP